MSRATPLSPDDRRSAIIAATLPLLLERGPEISTREIAQAAGVAEGTIYRAFDTKHDLIHATINAALAPDAAIAELAALPQGQTLAERTASILAVLHEEMLRKRALFSSLFGDRRPPHPPPGHGPGSGGHDARHRLFEATSAALSGHTAELRVEVDTAARVLFALAMALGFDSSNPRPTDAPGLADVVCHGIAQGE